MHDCVKYFEIMHLLKLTSYIIMHHCPARPSCPSFMECRPEPQIGHARASTPFHCTRSSASGTYKTFPSRSPSVTTSPELEGARISIGKEAEVSIFGQDHEGSPAARTREGMHTSSKLQILTHTMQDAHGWGNI